MRVVNFYDFSQGRGTMVEEAFFLSAHEILLSAMKLAYLRKLRLSGKDI